MKPTRVLPGRILLVAMIWLLAAVAVFAPRPALAAAPRLEGKRVLVLGDSITQDGRWVAFLEYYLLRQTPAVRSDLLSIGLSSETLNGLTEPGHPYPRPCLHDRLERALTLTKPAVVLACYGMNDGLYQPPGEARRQAFAAGLDRLLAAVRGAGATFVAITPPVFDPVPVAGKLAPEGATDFGYGKFYPGYDDVLTEFAALERERISAVAPVIDLHTAMKRELLVRRAKDAAFTFSGDGVHPGELGHLLMARVIAEGLGLIVPPVALETEVRRITADPVFALVRERRKIRSEAWLAFVGYTRGETVKRDSADDAEAAVRRLSGEIDALLAAPVAP